MPADAGRKVDGSRVTAPRVSGISYFGPSRGKTYRRDQRIQVLIEFDRAVSVTGVPQIALTIGTETRWANFLPIHPWEFIDPESTIFFCHTVRQEDRDTDGISIPANALFPQRRSYQACRRCRNGRRSDPRRGQHSSLRKGERKTVGSA